MSDPNNVNPVDPPAPNPNPLPPMPSDSQPPYPVEPSQTVQPVQAYPAPNQPYQAGVPQGYPQSPQQAPQQFSQQAPQMGYAQPYGQPPHTSGMAIASLVLAVAPILLIFIPILDFFAGLCFPVAAILGHVALRKINRINAAGGNEGGRGLAIAGIIIGWIFFGISLLVLLFVLMGIGALASLSSIH